MERSHIVNNQGKVIADMAEKIGKYNAKSQDIRDIEEHIKKLNDGNLFDAATAR
jgi:hypothetical protein